MMDPVSTSATAATSSDQPQNVWCHGCNKYSHARVVVDTGDFQCQDPGCRSIFVEVVGQGIETFFGDNSTISSPRNADIATPSSLTAATPSQPSSSSSSSSASSASSIDPLSSSGMMATSNTSNALSSTSRTAPSVSTSNTRDRATIERISNELLQQILSRVLGLGIQVRPQVHSTLLNVMQQAAAESGRPIGIVVRQAVSAEDLEILSTSLANGTLRSGLTPGSVGVTLGGLMGVGGVMGAARGGVGGRSSMSAVQGNANPNIPSERLEAQVGSGWLEDLMHHILMNESSYSATPAAKEAIDRLQRVKIGSHHVNCGLGDCSISQEAFVVGDVMVSLPCGHSFKEEPILQWLNTHDTCPVCRVQLPSQSASS